jgi:hypothetical protein
MMLATLVLLVGAVAIGFVFIFGAIKLAEI